MSSEALEATKPEKEIAELAVDAASRISDFVNQTPVYESKRFSEEGIPVIIKDETVHPGRSFKDRGAGNAVFDYAENGGETVMTASAGNHGKGLSRAATRLGLKSVVVVGESATEEKKDDIRQNGAELIVFGETFDEARPFAKKEAGERGARYIDPYADKKVKAGQATIALELLEQEPGMTHVIVPVGGGGLLTGVASVIKEHKENVKIIAAQADGTSAFIDSLLRGKPLQNQPVNSDYEGIAVGNVNPLNFEIASRLVDSTVQVINLELNHAIHDFKKETGTWLEYAGAVGPAAARLVAETWKLPEDSRIVTIATGANPPKSLISNLVSRAGKYGWR